MWRAAQWTTDMAARAAASGLVTRRAKNVRRPGVRERAAQATRDSILRAAIKVFARHGFDAGSVEKISSAAGSFDRMIYYYFGSKEGLFIAVLEEIYRRFNEAEAALALSPEHPIESLATVVHFMLDYYHRHPEFVTLLNSENLHRGRHIAKSLRASEYSAQAVGVVDQLLRSGAAQGVFRPDVPARDLYVMIAALGYFHRSNRYTLSAFLGEDLDRPAVLARWEAFVTDAVMRTVAPGAGAAGKMAGN
jgi:TetR/AcrR family transcriptional regulator, upper aerobic nicotinate degradation pathway regulator